MIKRILCIFLIVYSSSAVSMFGFSGQSYKQAAQESINKSCLEHIEKYKKILKKYPNSRYYKWKLDNWIQRCKKEKIL